MKHYATMDDYKAMIPGRHVLDIIIYILSLGFFPAYKNVDFVDLRLYQNANPAQVLMMFISYISHTKRANIRENHFFVQSY